jgi:predicted N-acyltransferase
MERIMLKQKREQLKAEFKQALAEFVETLKGHVSTPDVSGQSKALLMYSATFTRFRRTPKLSPKFLKSISFQNCLNLPAKITIVLF